jgi:hypothetical protein
MKHSYLSKKYKSPEIINPKIYSKKFEYLLSQNQTSKVIKYHELETWGLSQILYGLEYHFKRFRMLEKRQSPGNSTPSQFKDTVNEVTAYFNRLGQYYSCITSDWFQEYVKEEKLVSLCPSILALLPYRNKYSAHRSLDDPKGESLSQHESFSNVYLVNEWFGKVDHSEMHIGYQIKIGAKHRCHLLKRWLPLPVKDIEHFTDQDEIFVDFIPYHHHDRVISEAFRTLQQLF